MCRPDTCGTGFESWWLHLQNEIGSFKRPATLAAAVHRRASVRRREAYGAAARFDPSWLHRGSSKFEDTGGDS